jgi:hypothetical protein
MCSRDRDARDRQATLHGVVFSILAGSESSPGAGTAARAACEHNRMSAVPKKSNLIAMIVLPREPAESGNPWN